VIASHCQCEITSCSPGGKSTPQSEAKQRDGKEKGGGLGSVAQTRQLNAPWTWWISNWRLITSEVCWIIVSVMNWRDGAWQISAVMPLPELLGSEFEQQCVHLRLLVYVTWVWTDCSVEHVCVHQYDATLTCGKQQGGNEDEWEGKQRSKRQKERKRKSY